MVVGDIVIWYVKNVFVQMCSMECEFCGLLFGIGVCLWVGMIMGVVLYVIEMFQCYLWIYFQLVIEI